MFRKGHSSQEFPSVEGSQSDSKASPRHKPLDLARLCQEPSNVNPKPEITASSQQFEVEEKKAKQETKNLPHLSARKDFDEFCEKLAEYNRSWKDANSRLSSIEESKQDTTIKDIENAKKEIDRVNGYIEQFLKNQPESFRIAVMLWKKYNSVGERIQKGQDTDDDKLKRLRIELMQKSFAYGTIKRETSNLEENDELKRQKDQEREKIQEEISSLIGNSKSLDLEEDKDRNEIQPLSNTWEDYGELGVHAGVDKKIVYRDIYSLEVSSLALESGKAKAGEDTEKVEEIENRYKDLVAKKLVEEKETKQEVKNSPHLSAREGFDKFCEKLAEYNRNLKATEDRLSDIEAEQDLMQVGKKHLEGMILQQKKDRTAFLKNQPEPFRVAYRLWPEYQEMGERIQKGQDTDDDKLKRLRIELMQKSFAYGTIKRETSNLGKNNELKKQKDQEREKLQEEISSLIDTIGNFCHKNVSPHEFGANTNLHSWLDLGQQRPGESSSAKLPQNSEMVSSQKLGVEKFDHSDESRPEAPSFPDDQRFQTTLPRIIEKIREMIHKNDRKEIQSLSDTWKNYGKNFFLGSSEMIKCYRDIYSLEVSILALRSGIAKACGDTRAAKAIEHQHKDLVAKEYLKEKRW